MKKTWECSQVEVVHSSISVEEYNQILDEFAEMIYGFLCQLPENKPEWFPNFQAPYEQKRTGTDG